MSGRLRSLSLIATLAVASTLAGCASPAPAGGGPGPATGRSGGSGAPQRGITTGPTSTPPAPSGSGCPGGGGFRLSLAAGVTGQSSPVQAARYFVLHGSIPGYGTATSVWRAHHTDGKSQASVSAGSVTLHAWRLPDRTWVITGGERCR